MGEFCAELGRILDLKSIKTDEKMNAHTTFRIGGTADYYVIPESVEQLKAVVSLCRQECLPYVVLGNGSNLLVSDRGFRGVVIAMTDRLGGCVIHGAADACGAADGDLLRKVTAGAGIRLFSLAKKAAEASLTGLEFSAGIPGTLGGALVMNAGAYGFEMKDVLVSAKVLDGDGHVRSLRAEELELGYRTSCIPGKGYIVLEATLELRPGEHSAIQARMEEYSFRRRTKQPLDYPSAGSTFKRPVGHYAGALIEQAGLKGFRVGGAQVSEKHAGFVINKDHATAADVWKLCREVTARVRETSGVELEPEVKLLGESGWTKEWEYEAGHSDGDVGSRQDHRP